mmetsp:Transcript_5313/g.20000  ORF Transcript_5313/g.20000 Transcript_5313/m.20000 type:complete len:268 (+) Transcript_5313:455-1258(+)
MAAPAQQVPPAAALHPQAQGALVGPRPCPCRAAAESRAGQGAGTEAEAAAGFELGSGAHHAFVVVHGLFGKHHVALASPPACLSLQLLRGVGAPHGLRSVLAGFFCCGLHRLPLEELRWLDVLLEPLAGRSALAHPLHLALRGRSGVVAGMRHRASHSLHTPGRPAAGASSTQAPAFRVALFRLLARSTGRRLQLGPETLFLGELCRVLHAVVAAFGLAQRVAFPEAVNLRVSVHVCGLRTNFGYDLAAVGVRQFLGHRLLLARLPR